MTVGTAARAIVAWALRGTKQLSPHTTKIGPAKQFAFHAGKGANPERKLYYVIKGRTGAGFKHHKELRPWIKKVAVGDKSWLGSMGIGDKGRERFVTGYTKSYKHLRKHKKLYGAGGAGAAIWDFLPGKDNE
tara:strand:- start:466 stop:861 length:396 start_codon:yes stop_codon:yes gene_type:complete